MYICVCNGVLAMVQAIDRLGRHRVPRQAKTADGWVVRYCNKAWYQEKQNLTRQSLYLLQQGKVLRQTVNCDKAGYQNSNIQDKLTRSLPAIYWHIDSRIIVSEKSVW